MLNIPSLRKLTERSLVAIAELKHLEILNISDCINIRSDHLINLKNLKLKTFHANNLKLVDSELQVIKYLKELENLSIEGNR